jgi:putative endonuclease
MEPDVSFNNKIKNKVIGRQGELVCARYYKDQGFELIEMNFQKKYGEIDIIVKKSDKVHFIEVKTVSYETKSDLEYAVTHGTWRPEENVHQSKLKKIARVIEVWVSEHKWRGYIQIDVAAVRIVPRETYALINIIENVILE